MKTGVTADATEPANQNNRPKPSTPTATPARCRCRRHGRDRRVERAQRSAGRHRLDPGRCRPDRDTHAQPDREPVRKQARKPIQKHRETARERAKREYSARKEYLARKQARERAAYLARERLRHMSPSEKRRLYFENFERQRRAGSRRETRFTDIWR